MTHGAILQNDGRGQDPIVTVSATHAMVPLLTLREVVTSTATYVLVWKLIHVRVKQYGPVKYANIVLHRHSCVQVIVSFALLLLILLSLAPLNVHSTTVLQIIQANDAFLPRYSLHCSRFFEYLDIIFFVASGNTPDAHFVFHHLTTPYLTYFRVMNDYELWQVFTGLNGVHHVLMHLFFAGVTCTQAVLPWTRYIQLIVGIACDLYIGRTRMMVGDKACTGYAVSAALLSCYLVLLTRELRARRQAKQRLETE
jgi:hypothetical protein